MNDTLRIVTAFGVAAVLVLLRLQAERFGTAEYDEPSNRYGRAWTRLAWYGLGLGLLLLVFTIHPAPQQDLFLVMGDRLAVLGLGLFLAAAGILQAAAFARFRYGDMRPPPADARLYAGAALNSVATAVVDEATFRGIVLGGLLVAGLPFPVAVVAQTMAYVLATRMAAPGRSLYMLALAAGMGLVLGTATYVSGGIGAAILAHSATSFALFACTSHAGQVARFGEEPEEVEALHHPEGWFEVPPRMKQRPGTSAASTGLAPRSGSR